MPRTQKELSKCLLGSVNEPEGPSLSLPESTEDVAITRAPDETQFLFQSEDEMIQ